LDAHLSEKVHPSHYLSLPENAGTVRYVERTDTILHNTLRNRLSLCNVSNPSPRKKLPFRDLPETKQFERGRDLTGVGQSCSE